MKVIKLFMILSVPAVILSFSMLPLYAATPSPPVGQTQTVEPPVNQNRQIPGGQTGDDTVSQADGIGADIFGTRGGRYHPFIVLQQVYTDNFFATNTDTRDEFITTVSPGIWLAFPANRERLLDIDTTKTASGGLKLSRIKPETNRRYQTYFLYSPEFVFYADHSQHDHINHRAEGLFQYNFNAGISLDVIDIYRDREEIAGNGLTDRLYRHQDNLFDVIVSYLTPSGKLRLQLDYSNYDLSYDDEPVQYRDRNDNSFGASVFYQFWPKTSLFLEYDHADIKFDSGTINDNSENRYFGGVTWEMTAKSKGTLKLGFIEKDFDSPAVADQDGFSLELQTQHNITAKQAIQANGYRRFHESDLVGASSFLSTGIDISFLQRFTEKWSGTFNLFYERNEYSGVTRDDDFYGISPAIRFKPKRWLFFDLGYYYFRNNSDNLTFDYEAQQILFRVTAAI